MSKLLAIFSAFVGVTMGAVPLSALTGGAQGYVAIIGVIAGVGGIGMLALTGTLWRRSAPPPERGPLRHTLGQRLIMLALALFCFGTALKAVFFSGNIGTLSKSSSKSVSREHESGSFWTYVLVYSGGGAGLMFLALRRERK